MVTARVKATFPYMAGTVWRVVTSNEQYAWRSDLSRIEILEPGKSFVEYTKDGYPTMFTITAFEPCTRYAFELENDNMKGRWTGVFSCDNGQTTIVFTEEVTAKKLLLKPFVGLYLKKQQAIYIADLKRALNRL